MKATYLRIISVLAAVVILMCGCMDNLVKPGGKEVKFKALSKVSYLTKTSYSGEVNASSLERIDWEDGDVIRIVSDVAATEGNAHSQDYSLSTPNASGKFSYATASPSGSAHGLLWGSGTNSFYAVYPAGTLVYDGGSSIATFSLPADQSGTTHNNDAYYGNMDLAFMTAATTGTEGDDITLSFTPAITTFYVTVTNTTGNTMSLEKVSLICDNEPLSGSYTAEISGVTALDDEHNARNYRLDYLFNDGGTYSRTLPTVSDANNTIYASFSPALSLANNASVVVALFAMPRNAFNSRSGYGVSGVDGVSGKGGFISHLTLSVTSGDGVVSLPLKDKDSGEWITFASEHKHNISNVRVPSVASYVLDVDPTLVEYDHTGDYSDQEFTVISHKTINSVQKAAPWKTQIQIGGNWVDLSTVISDPTTYPEYQWLQYLPQTSESTAEVVTENTSRTFHKNVTGQDVVSHEDRLKRGKVLKSTAGSLVPLFPTAEEATTYSSSYETNSTAATAVDLSKYNFVSHKIESARYTANTYIISAPGYYKIPIVYGNAIENDSYIPDSYNGRSGLGHLNYFICPTAEGTESSIHLVSTRPWLDSDRSQGARIHWEKYSYWNPNPSLPEGGEMVTYTRGWGTAAPVSVIDNLNIEIGSGNERFIVFHVDENNIRPGNWLIASTSEADGSGNVCWSWQIWITDQDMTPVTINNGSTDYSILPVNLGWTDLNRGQFYPQREVTLRFASTEKAGLYSAHNLTVRQKKEEIVSKKGWSTFYQWGRKDPLTDGIAVAKDNDGYVHKSILHPNNMYYDKSSFFGERYYDWTIHNYGNLWDSKNTAYETPAGTLPNHKSVYDPSPRRYCVPPDYTWDGFSTSTYQSVDSDGIYFYTDATKTNTVFFPASGLMAFTTATSSKGNDIKNAYWTYHPYKRVQRRASYALSFTYNNSTEAISISTADYTDNGRAYGYSVRPVYYGVAVVTGLMETELVFANAGWSDGQNVKGVGYTYNGVTVTFDRYNSTGLVSVDDPVYSASNQSIKLDWYNSITISMAMGKQISEIVLEFAEEDPESQENGSTLNTISKYSPDGGTYSSGSWYADANNGVLSPQTNTVVLRTAQVGYHEYRYIKSIRVTYKD